MLSRARKLGIEAEGRYAADSELVFWEEYAASFALRRDAYRHLRAAEKQIVEQTQAKLVALYPNFFKIGKQDLSTKWKADTLRVLRHCATAVLTADNDRFRETFLVWFQTLMQAFVMQEQCNRTYELLQTEVKRLLPPAEAALVCEALELSRQILGEAAPR